MLPPWIVGQLFETTGPKSVIFSVFGFSVVQVFVFTILMKKMNSEHMVLEQSVFRG